MNKIQCSQSHFYEPAFEGDETCSYCATVSKNIFKAKAGDNDLQPDVAEFSDLHIKDGARQPVKDKVKFVYHTNGIQCGNYFNLLNGSIESPCSSCREIERGRDASALPSGGTLNNNSFLVGRLLGKVGRFNMTYLCWDIQRGEVVVIKELFPKEIVHRSVENNSFEVLAVDEDKYKEFVTQRDKFLEEAKVLSKISHPAVVGCKQYFLENNTVYVVTDYCSGRSLAELIDQQGGLSYDDTINLLWPIMGGLREVHHLGIFHGDITPENILIAKNGQPTLLGFSHTRLALYDNTVNEIDASADVHTLCVLMYYCITGVRPESAKKGVVNQHSLKSFESLGITVPALMKSIIYQGVAFQKHNRYQSVKSLQVTLKSFRLQQKEYVWQKRLGDNDFGKQMRAASYGGGTALTFSFAAAIFQWFWLFSYRLTKYGIASLLVTALAVIVLAYHHELWPYSVLIVLLNGVVCGFFGLPARYHYIDQWVKNQPVDTPSERIETTESLLSLEKPSYSIASIGLAIFLVFMLIMFFKHTYETGIREQVSMALRLENLRQQVREMHDKAEGEQNPKLETLSYKKEPDDEIESIELVGFSATITLALDPLVQGTQAVLSFHRGEDGKPKWTCRNISIPPKFTPKNCINSSP